VSNELKKLGSIAAGLSKRAASAANEKVKEMAPIVKEKMVEVSKEVASQAKNLNDAAQKTYAKESEGGGVGVIWKKYGKQLVALLAGIVLLTVVALGVKAYFSSEGKRGGPIKIDSSSNSANQAATANVEQKDSSYFNKKTVADVQDKGERHEKTSQVTNSKWEPYGKNGAELYYDKNSIKRKWNFVIVKVVDNSNSTDIGFRSHLYWNLFNCTTKASGTFSSYYYKGEMGTGQLADEEDETNIDEREIINAKDENDLMSIAGGVLGGDWNVALFEKVCK
jgi:hypothetical protein